MELKTRRPAHRARYLAGHLLLALIGACAAAPVPYQPAETSSSAGYSEVRIEADRFRVTVRGLSASHKEETETYARRRAAELTLQSGYAYYRIARLDLHRAEARSAGLEDVFPPTPFGLDPYVSSLRRIDRSPAGPAVTVLEFVMSARADQDGGTYIDAAALLKEPPPP